MFVWIAFTVNVHVFCCFNFFLVDEAGRQAGN
jgi:hypothetical protein